MLTRDKQKTFDGMFFHQTRSHRKYEKEDKLHAAEADVLLEAQIHGTIWID